jgi:hypothetical protein
MRTDGTVQHSPVPSGSVQYRPAAGGTFRRAVSTRAKAVRLQQAPLQLAAAPGQRGDHHVSRAGRPSGVAGQGAHLGRPSARTPPGHLGDPELVHDTTIREAFDTYQQQRVNITGQPISYDPGAPTAGAEWVKHNLSRIRDSLPNGYCGRPHQQACPHPNACLTCPDFQTTPQFLDIHRRQAATNLRLITHAEASGQTRLAASLRQVQANLEKIIPALESLPADPEETGHEPG